MADDINKCHYCDNTICDPYKLDCGDYVCLSCAQEAFVDAVLTKPNATSDEMAAKATKLAKNNSAATNSNDILLSMTQVTIQCPECKKNSLIERAIGPQSTTNSQQQQQQREKIPPPTINCAECETSAADWHCNNCEDKFCDKCFTATHLSRTLAKHTKVTITAHKSPVPVLSSVIKFSAKHYCNSHPTNEIQYYCSSPQCQKIICADCCALIGAEHHGHKVIPLTEYVEKIGKVQANEFKSQKLPLLKQELLACQLELQQKFDLVDESKSSTTKELKKRFDAGRKLVNSKQETMEKELVSQIIVYELELRSKFGELN